MRSLTATRGGTCSSRREATPDDVVPEAALHEVRGLAGVEAEGRRLELGHHGSPREAAEVAAALRRALVLGGLLRDLAEITARLHLGEQRLGQAAGLGVGVALGGLGAGLHLHEDVAGADLLLLLELVLVLLVVGLEVAVGDGDPRAKGFLVDEQVGQDPLLGNAIGVLGALEAGLDLVVRGRHLSPERARPRPPRTRP